MIHSEERRELNKRNMVKYKYLNRWSDTVGINYLLLSFALEKKKLIANPTNSTYLLNMLAEHLHFKPCLLWIFVIASAPVPDASNSSTKFF